MRVDEALILQRVVERYGAPLTQFMIYAIRAEVETMLMMWGNDVPVEQVNRTMDDLHEQEIGEIARFGKAIGVAHVGPGYRFSQAGENFD